MQRVVMKFGGTSVGIASNFARAQALVLARAARDPKPPVVVVSALTGVTNVLVEFCALPSRRVALGERIRDRHLSFATEVGVGVEPIAGLLAEWRETSERLARGDALAGELRDRVLAFGG